MKYRSKTEIVEQVLSAAIGGSTKTKIMYKAFLSYSQLGEYLTLLVAGGFLEYEQGRLIYKTSHKGIQYLRKVEEINKFINISAVEG